MVVDSPLGNKQKEERKKKKKNARYQR